MGRAAEVLMAAFFAVMAGICFSLETHVCMGETPRADHPNSVVRQSYFWGLEADRVWVVQPHWSRVAVCFHAFFFGPFYALFCLAFLLRWNWVRWPGVLVGTAKLYAGAYYITTNLLDPSLSPAKPLKFLAQSATYMVIPFALVVWMLADTPFPRARPTSGGKSHSS